MKKKGWAIGIIVVGVLYLALVSFTLLNSLTSLIFFSPKNEFEPILTQEQAVLLTKQACELHNKAVVYTNEALNADADKKTYQEWEQDVDTALKLWDQLGEVTGLLQYNSGIKKQADQPLREFFTFFSPAKQLWFAGAGEDNFADRLRDIGTLFESDRALSDAYLKAAQQSVSEADWQADNENVGSMQVNLAKLRETLKVQHADRSFSQRDETIDFEFAGTDTILLIGDDILYIISNSGSGQAFSANTNTYSNLWTADETHEGQYIMAPKDALFLRTYDVDKPVFLEAKADEIFKETYSVNGLYEVDVTQEMDAKNGPAKYKDDSSGDENAAALEAEAISAPEPTPDTGEAQEESPESDISDQDEDDADADETPAATEQSPVVFIDSAFESMMRIALNKNSEAIYQSDLDQIEKLTIAGSAFAWVGDAYSLDYFGQDNYCINGEKYDDMGTIARVDDLSKFTNLKELTIIYNDIRNIDGIGDAPALEKADLSVNAITDISPIYRSGTLEYINFGLNDIMNETGKRTGLWWRRTRSVSMMRQGI